MIFDPGHTKVFGLARGQPAADHRPDLTLNLRLLNWGGCGGSRLQPGGC